MDERSDRQIGRLWAAGLVAGWLLALADVFAARGALPAPLYGGADELLLWLAVTAVLSAAGGAAGAALGAIVAIARRLTRSDRLASLVTTAAVIAPLWALNAPLSATSPRLFWGGLGGATAGGLALVTLWGVVAGHPRAPRQLHPMTGAGLLVAAAAAWQANRTVLPGLYPRQHASLALVSVVAATVALALLLRRSRSARPDAGDDHAEGPDRRTLALTLTSALVWLTAFVGVRGEYPQAVRLTVAGHTVTASHALALLERPLDVDRDGYASLLGETDCDGWDGDIHPGAVDRPGDGIDQDCLAGDADPAAIATLDAWERSRALHPGARPTGQSVILITVDALRRDRGAKMASVGKLAARGVSFDRAWAPYPSTILGFYALMTGRAPSTVATERWIRWDIPTPDRSQTLPEVLHAAGYHTEGIAFHHIFAPEHGLVRGFDDMWTASSDSRVVSASWSGDQTADRALAFLSRVDRSRPFFLWVHFYDPHEPYLVHPETPPDDAGDLIQLYDGEVRYTDIQLGRLVDSLLATGELDRSLVVLTADHGESLGEHGLRFHASALYDDQLRVPFVVAGPGVPRGEVREDPVGLLSLAATLADLLGVPAPAGAVAGSFAALVVGPPAAGAEAPPVFSEVLPEAGAQRMIVLWPWKLIHNVRHHTFELYDLSRDAEELVNVVDAVPERADALRALLGTWAAAIHLPPGGP